MRQRDESLDPIRILKEDHKSVKALFDEFQATGDKNSRRRLMEAAVRGLRIHAEIEETLFYPELREAMDDETLLDLAQEEHHVVHVLIDEIEEMNFIETEAKFKVLAENVRRHIKEEEKEMLPRARETDVDMDHLGRKMAELKEQLEGDLKVGVIDIKSRMKSARQRGGLRSAS